MTRITVNSGISNPTIGELKEFLKRVPASANDQRLRVSVMKDRPFDPEVVSIQVSWDQELIPSDETDEQALRQKYGLDEKQTRTPQEHNGVGITGQDIVDGKLPDWRRPLDEQQTRDHLGGRIIEER